MRPLSLIAAAALLLAGGCTDNYGQVDYGRTALLGVGVVAAAAVVAGALSDQPRPYRGGGGYNNGYRGGYGGGGGYRQQPSYRGGGYGRPYRGGW